MNTSYAAFESESQYLTLRRKLVTFFNYRRCPDPEDLADETVTRVIASTARGAAPVDVNRWGYGIARLVYLESLRDPNRQAEPGAEDLAGEVLSPCGEKLQMVAQTAVGDLDLKDRDLLEEHYFDGVSFKILAQRRGITAVGLRVHVCRLRQGLARQLADEMR